MTNKQAQFLDTRDGYRLAYEIAGEGLPLVLIHGWTFDRTMWEQQVPELSQHFKTVIYDRRGFGESNGKPEIRKELDDLNDLLDHLDMDRACILGMSQGGRIALRYTIIHPERVQAVILQGVSLDGYAPASRLEDRIPLDHYSSLTKQGKIKTVREEWMKHPLMHIPTPNSSVKKQVRKIICRYSGEDLTDDLTEQMAFQINISERLHQISIPTLLIEGRDEISALKDVANKLQQDIKGSKKIIIDGGGHLISFIEPEKYNLAVIDFLKKNQA